MNTRTRLFNLTISIVALSLLAGMSIALGASGSGTADDGYCRWNYSFQAPYGDHRATGHAKEVGTGCELVDVDITEWVNYTNQTMSTYCSAHTSERRCTTPQFTLTGSANVRLGGLDWEYSSWQILNKQA